MQAAALIQRWHQLFPAQPVSLLEKEWQCLVSRYSETHRHYHDLSHIAACLNWLDKVRDQLENPRAVELALWFHDFVYNPRNNDNEYVSAEYAVVALSLLGENKNMRDEVQELIMVTRHPSRPVTQDQQWMVDIDLAILGAEPAIYDCYAGQIRQEYIHVPEPFYAAGRKMLLESFLKTPSLYYTEWFRQRLEVSARANLAREIAQLQ